MNMAPGWEWNHRSDLRGFDLGAAHPAVDIGRLINSGSIPNTLIAITNGIGRITLIVISHPRPLHWLMRLREVHGRSNAFSRPSRRFAD